MADISQYLNAILAAIYGEEVRGSIHDAIQAINNEVVSSTLKSDNAVLVANGNILIPIEYAFNVDSMKK